MGRPAKISDSEAKISDKYLKANTPIYIPKQAPGLSKVYFRSILELQSQTTLDARICCDILPYFSARSRTYHGKSVINFLTIIDLNQTNISKYLVLDDCDPGLLWIHTHTYFFYLSKGLVGTHNINLFNI